MDKANTEKLDVEASRTKRLERVKAKQRDRGGIFKPSDSNPLIDILLSRKFPSKSPAKPRLSKAGTLLKSRKSKVGVPKTPRKSLARQPLSQAEKEEQNQDLNGLKKKAGKLSKAASKNSGKSSSLSRASTSKAMESGASSTTQGAETSKAGPSPPRNNTSGIGLAAQKQPLTAVSRENTDPKPGSRQNSRKNTEGSKSKAKAKRKADTPNAVSMSKGKEIEVVTDHDDNDKEDEGKEKSMGVVHAEVDSSSHNRKSRKKRNHDEASVTESLPKPARKKPKKNQQVSRKAKLLEGGLKTITEEEGEPVLNKKEAKRSSDENEGAQRPSKKARFEDNVEKKKVSFKEPLKKRGKAKEKPKRELSTKDEDEVAVHVRKNTQTSTKGPKASSSVIKDKTVDGTDEGPLEEPSIQTMGKKTLSSSEVKAENVSLSNPSKDNSKAADSAPRKQLPLSLSAGPGRKKPDMSFKMRSLSYPSTLLGSPLKALDSERDPLDLI